MANPASILLDQASIVLQDVARTRWELSELIGWLNEGIKACCSVNPTAWSYPENLSLVAGIRQDMPDNAVLLLDMHRNIASGFAIRFCDRAIMDSMLPGWPNEKATKDVEHFMYDPKAPNIFHVYPPNDGSGEVEITFAGIPPDLGDVSDELPLRAHFNPPLLDYILYRAYGKDSEYAANSAKADSHYAHFASAIGSDPMISGKGNG